MLSLEAHRAIVKAALPEQAFLRIDRKNALFVSDAPRFAEKETLALDGYDLEYSGNLLRITPTFEGVPQGLKDVCLGILKSGSKEQKNRLIRTNLAKAMRTHDREKTAFLMQLLRKEEEDEDQLVGTRLF